MPGFSSAPGRRRTPGRSRPPALPPGAAGHLPHVARGRTWTSAEPLTVIHQSLRSPLPAKNRAAVPSTALPQPQRLGEEFVVGVLVLEILPHLNDLAVADVEHQDLTILKGLALTLT